MLAGVLVFCGVLVGVREAVAVAFGAVAVAVVRVVAVGTGVGVDVAKLFGVAVVVGVAVTDET